MFLQIDRLSVQYASARRTAVSEVSFGLARGQIGALIGPSGCGKTSLLRAIAGLERPSAGRVLLAGAPVADAARDLHEPPEQRRIGMVFQDYALFPHLSVAANVAFGLAGRSRLEQRERVMQMLDLVGLAAAAKRYPHQLSGGQQQRVALARALAPQPRLLLMDEPFSSLDVDLRERLAQEVRAILKQTDTTALFVTHDQNEAFAVGDQIGVMNHGRLEQWDEPYTVYHRPATRFVAGFVGRGVFTAAQIIDGDDGPKVRTPLGDLTDMAQCPLPGWMLAKPGAAGTLAAIPTTQRSDCDVLLRADDVVHDASSPVRAQILSKTFRGQDFLYTLRLPSGDQLLAHVPSHQDHAVGEWIGIRAAMDHVVTFPRLAP